MSNKTYNFSDTERVMNEWQSASEISMQLKDSLLMLVGINDDNKERILFRMTEIIADTCRVLDTIKPITEAEVANDATRRAKEADEIIKKQIEEAYGKQA